MGKGLKHITEKFKLFLALTLEGAWNKDSKISLNPKPPF